MLTDPTQSMGNQALASRAMNAQALAAQEVSEQSGAMSSGKPVDMVAAKKAAQSFEAVFLTQMMEHMFEGVGKDTMFGGGSGEEMFRPMLFEEYGKLMAQRGGIGIADAVLRTLVKQQEKTQ